MTSVPPVNLEKSAAMSLSEFASIDVAAPGFVDPFSALSTSAKVSTPLEPRLSIIWPATSDAVTGAASLGPLALELGGQLDEPDCCRACRACRASIILGGI